MTMETWEMIGRFFALAMAAWFVLSAFGLYFFVDPYAPQGTSQRFQNFLVAGLIVPLISAVLFSIVRFVLIPAVVFCITGEAP